MRNIMTGLLLLTAMGLNAGWGTQYSDGDFYKISTAVGHNLVTTANTDLTVTRLSSHNYNDFGYFTFDSNKNILSQGVLNFGSGNTATISNLNAGTNVGFWISTSTGTTYSVQSMNTNYFYAMNRYEYDAAGEAIFRMGGYGNYSVDNIRFTVTGSSPSPQPSGQPLPGVILTALVAMGCGSFALRKKRRKPQA